MPRWHAPRTSLCPAIKGLMRNATDAPLCAGESECTRPLDSRSSSSTPPAACFFSHPLARSFSRPKKNQKNCRCSRRRRPPRGSRPRRAHRRGRCPRLRPGHGQEGTSSFDVRRNFEKIKKGKKRAAIFPSSLSSSFKPSWLLPPIRPAFCADDGPGLLGSQQRLDLLLLRERNQQLNADKDRIGRPNREEEIEKNRASALPTELHRFAWTTSPDDDVAEKKERHVLDRGKKLTLCFSSSSPLLPETETTNNRTP